MARRWLEKLAPVLAAAALGAFVVWVLFPPRRQDALVVYCALDAEFAEPLLRRFERETGIPVVVRFDTEANKSLGLVQQIQREAGAPRCDLFWNNEWLGTAELGAQGLLLPYSGPNRERIPPRFRGPNGAWHGFAARLRVWIIHTGRAPDEAAQAELCSRLPLDARALDADLSRLAIARPMYGTTLTHYAVLWNQVGGDALQAWDAEARRRGLRILAGNATVKDAVADGICDAGWTDTDDFFSALDARKPVAMRPVMIGARTICIPNTVAVIRGTRRRAAAEALAAFLLSEQTEIELARAPSRQIPLGTVDESTLPPEVRALRAHVESSVPLGELLDARRACLEWLSREAAR